MIHKLYNLVFISLVLARAGVSKAQVEVCNIHCDGREAAQAVEPRTGVTTEIYSRILSLRISDIDNMGFALIENGEEGDEVWLDRSFDGGKSWVNGSKLGDTLISEGLNQAQSLMFNVDDPTHYRIGALRVCGKAENMEDIACTDWARSTVNAGTHMDAAATALMQMYAENGLFERNGWWTGANALTAIIDYSHLTGYTEYLRIIDTSFELNKDKEHGNFTNTFVDDTLWWGLAWSGAYEVTGVVKYLEMAKFDADYAYSYSDDVCGGGLYWKTDRGSKNAIQNELFIKLAAKLHNQIPGDTEYLRQAVEVWDWFNATGFINSGNLINDGIRLTDCSNNGEMTWTYNQGVVVGGLVELFKATGDDGYLTQARKITDAVISSPLLTVNGVLSEPCEGWGDCGSDGPSFKGAAIRNFGELNRILPGKPYSAYLQAQVEALKNPDSYNTLNQYGLYYAGPFDNMPGHGRQHSALEGFTAAL